MSKKKIKLDDSMYKGYKLRLYPTKKQIEKFNQYFGMVRFVYNKGKELCDEYYNNHVNMADTKYNYLTFEDLCSRMTKLKNGEYQWLNEYSSDTMRTVLKDLIHGYEAYAKGITNHLPVYKAKKNANQSFPTRKDRMSILGNWIRLSSFNKDPIYIANVPKELQGFSNQDIDTNKPGHMKIYEGYSYLEYCNPRISYDGIHYYISFTLKRCDDNGNIIPDHDYASTKKFKCNNEWDDKPSSDIIGLDWGNRHDNWFVDSKGNRLNRPNQTKIEKQIAGYQKKLARQKRINKKKHIVRTKQYYTKNEEKTLNRMNKAYKKHTNQRINIMHNFINTVIADKPEAVVLETLNIKDIMQCGIPKKVKLIRDSLHYTFIEAFKYKCEANGIKVIFAPDGFKSSQTCSRCGNEYKIGNTRTYKCPHCGLKIDRDLNAAINLRDYGYELLHAFDNVSSLNIA